MSMATGRVFLTGATGFVGRHLYPVLVREGCRVVCGSRRPLEGARRYPSREFRYLDVEDADSIETALRGCDHAVYLVHAMAGGRDYEDVEGRGARNFLRVAERQGLSRIVYLGGMRPSGTPSRHLRSRLATGETLRSGRLSTLELQATMIIGNGSESWRIVRDLAARLPVMILPRWLASRSQPVGIDDVTFAIDRALSLSYQGSGILSVPGPEELSGREILERTARLLGSEPRMVGIPVVTPRLSSYWIRMVARANRHIAEELVEGLRTDSIAPDEGIWKYFPEHERLSFQEASRRALLEEMAEMPWRTRTAEAFVRKLGSVALKTGRPRPTRG